MNRRSFIKSVVLMPLAGAIIPVTALEMKEHITMDKFNVVTKFFRKDRGGGRYLITALGTNQYLGETMITHTECGLINPLPPEASHSWPQIPGVDHWADCIDEEWESSAIDWLKQDIRKKFSRILEARKV